jgi:hypothetical protein
VVRAAIVALFFVAPSGYAYSVLTHEAVVDAAWDKEITPLLLKRFPHTTKDQLLEAHAYAYGGCLIQDLGYYPFGSKFFSDLLHYVRTGDFVLNMVHESRDVDEYAFSLGALAHYAADNSGHPIAVNESVPLEYPKLKREFGPEVTYEDAPAAHIRVEFGFDVVQVARGNYAPKSYHDFIGFEVSKDLLDRAFRDTYSLELGDVFKSVDLAIGTFRKGVSAVIPELTKTAWAMKGDELVKADRTLTRRKFVYNLSRSSYEREWGDRYERPGVFARVLALLLRIVPKVGPFKALAFKKPTPETIKLFEESFNRTLELYRNLLAGVGGGRLQLEDANLDTGEPSRPGDYFLADETYEKLAIKLAAKHPATIDPVLLKRVLAFVDGPRSRDAKHDRDREDAEKALATLRVLSPSAVPAR